LLESAMGLGLGEIEPRHEDPFAFSMSLRDSSVCSSSRLSARKRSCSSIAEPPLRAAPAGFGADRLDEIPKDPGEGGALDQQFVAERTENDHRTPPLFKSRVARSIPSMPSRRGVSSTRSGLSRVKIGAASASPERGR